MSRMKFYCDDYRCVDCNGCVVACKEAHEIPVGVNRRRVITINEGIEGKQKSLSVACMHCSDAPCQKVCPTDCFYIRTDGIVLHDKEKCIGCGYCLYACPFGAPQFGHEGIFGVKGVMDKCTFCAGGPDETLSETEFEHYGQNRIAEGKIPMCASMCATKALIAGDAAEVDKIYEYRTAKRGENTSLKPYGWEAYNNGK